MGFQQKRFKMLLIAYILYMGIMFDLALQQISKINKFLQKYISYNMVIIHIILNLLQNVLTQI